LRKIRPKIVFQQYPPELANPLSKVSGIPGLAHTAPVRKTQISVKRSKYIAAGAVLICALGAVVIGAMVFVPYLAG